MNSKLYIGLLAATVAVGGSVSQANALEPCKWSAYFGGGYSGLRNQGITLDQQAAPANIMTPTPLSATQNNGGVPTTVTAPIPLLLFNPLTGGCTLPSANGNCNTTSGTAYVPKGSGANSTTTDYFAISQVFKSLGSTGTSTNTIISQNQLKGWSGKFGLEYNTSTETFMFLEGAYSSNKATGFSLSADDNAAYTTQTKSMYAVLGAGYVFPTEISAAPYIKVGAGLNRQSQMFSQTGTKASNNYNSPSNSTLAAYGANTITAAGSFLGTTPISDTALQSDDSVVKQQLSAYTPYQNGIKILTEVGVTYSFSPAAFGRLGFSVENSNAQSNSNVNFINHTNATLNTNPTIYRAKLNDNMSVNSGWYHTVSLTLGVLMN